MLLYTALSASGKWNVIMHVLNDVVTALTIG